MTWIEDYYERQREGPEFVKLGERYSIARKEYDCTNCMHKIRVGDKYLRQTYLVDKSFEMYRMHSKFCGVRRISIRMPLPKQFGKPFPLFKE